MKIKTVITTFDSVDDLIDYINTNHHKPLKVQRDVVAHQFKVYEEQEVTEPEFNMGNLSYIAKEHDLTMEQRNAIDYAISAIKTLIDMGVIK